MKNKSFIITGLLLVLCIAFSVIGSSSLIKTVDSLLTPPLYYSEYEDLVECFNRFVEGEFVLCSPSNGDYTSAISVDDFDGDGRDDAIIIYRQPQSEAMANVCFLKKSKEGWNAINTFQGYGNDVNSIHIGDIDGNGEPEAMVIWSYRGIGSGYVFAVYGRSDSGVFDELANETCDTADILDVDADGTDEVFYISSSSDGSVITRTASVMKYKNGKIREIGRTEVDPNVAMYYQPRIENPADGAAPGIFVDAIRGDKKMITEKIVWDSEAKKLIAPLYDKEAGANILSVRYEQIECRDVDSDGLIEIPVQFLCNTTHHSETPDDVLYITKWTVFEGNNPEVKETEIINADDGYAISIDKSGIKNPGVRKYKSRNCWIIFEDDGKLLTGNELFSIMKVPVKRWENEDFSSYERLFDVNNDVICAYITDEGADTEYDKEKLSGFIRPLQ